MSNTTPEETPASTGPVLAADAGQQVDSATVVIEPSHHRLKSRKRKRLIDGTANPDDLGPGTPVAIYSRVSTEEQAAGYSLTAVRCLTATNYIPAATNPSSARRCSPSVSKCVASTVAGRAAISWRPSALISSIASSAARIAAVLCGCRLPTAISTLQGGQRRAQPGVPCRWKGAAHGKGGRPGVGAAGRPAPARRLAGGGEHVDGG